MGKVKISKNQKKSIKNIKKPIRFSRLDPSAYIRNPKNIVNAIAECLLNNDPEGIVEVIDIYLKSVNVVEFSKKNNIPRINIYNTLRNKNPTIKTLAKILHAAA